MGNALQLSSGHVVNAGVGVLTALTMNAGDSATIPNFATGAGASLLLVTAHSATVGSARVRSPRLHDQAQGIRLARPAGEERDLLPRYGNQPLYPGDNLILEMDGGAAENGVMSILTYYQDVPGIAARLYRWGDVEPKIANILGVETDLTGGAAATYGPTVALNANFDTLKSGTDYALLGYLCNVKSSVVGLLGPDTGNLFIGGPGSVNPPETRDYFIDLSENSGFPCIPVINANNRGVTLAKSVDIGGATAVHVTWILAELHA